MNTWNLDRLFISGTKPEGAFGCAALPNMENEFREHFQQTLEYAKALNCKKYTFSLDFYCDLFLKNIFLVFFSKF